MATPSTPSSVILLLLCFLFACPTPTHSEKSTYIVHMSHSHKPASFASHHEWYSSLLHSLSSSSNTTTSTDLLYSYSRSATGFAAHISKAHATELRKLPSVLSVVADEIVEPYTTQSPSFLGLAEGSGIWHHTNYGSGMIIGVVDSGIWPESDSFKDDDMGQVPSRWKGSCQEGPDFSAELCNKKLIGAQFFYKGYEKMERRLIQTKSARDESGHGTHCASIAAGSKVLNANYEGYALGTARGVAPYAHIAAYKVFWGKPSSGSSADVLMAMDQAIEDGVDVLSLSLSTTMKTIVDYDNDDKAIASFRAMQEGVVVVAAGGNSGPTPFSVKNVSPWMLTVASSTINRTFSANVVLGNGEQFRGYSLSDFGGLRNNSTASLILVTGQTGGSRYCNQGSLKESKVAGKIVICQMAPGKDKSVEKSFAVQEAGGVAMILVNLNVENTVKLKSSGFIIPAVSVTRAHGARIMQYASSSKSSSAPTATIKFEGTVISTTPPSPMLAASSGRGPNELTPQILKPDITAPGVNILAAWPSNLAPSKLDIDERRADFKFMSGTSMACPHVSGLAALLKRVHPSWTPGAIKSAIMTTSYNIDNVNNNFMDMSSGMQSTPFVHGAGHIDPQKALDPGLVYDLNDTDYVDFLCSIGYGKRRIMKFVKDATIIDCSAKRLSKPGDLNYPSFAVRFNSDKEVVTYTRVVTNVGGPDDAEYQVTVNSPDYVHVDVSPEKLVFGPNQRELSYTITFTSIATFQVPTSSLTVSSGSIEWSDESNNHHVKSPIAVYWRIRTTQDNLIASI